MSSGYVSNLNEGKGEVLHALLNSLSSNASSSQNGDRFTPGQVERLSSKLNEILGGVDSIDGEGQKRNEKGELLNEEGLPIVDIAEPVTDATGASGTTPVPLEDDRDLIPLWAAGPAERERRRIERDRLLDLLEEEERAEQVTLDERARESQKAEVEKRKEAARKEMDRLKTAKEMQKKMGKALLRNMSEAKAREEAEKQRQLREDLEAEEQKRREASKPRKSVSFAELSDVDDSEAVAPPSPHPNSLEGEAVTPTISRRSVRGEMPTQDEIEGHPMKINIVERFPVAARPPTPIARPSAKDKDSDDESNPDSPPVSDDEDMRFADKNQSDEDEESDDEPVLEDEYDLDSALHQREVALEYFKKRVSIGAEVKRAMASHTHDEGEHEWDQPEVPMEATLSSPPPKPSTSRFKANRKQARNNPGPSSSVTMASTSLGGATILPASASQKLNRVIRTGKLEGDKLVGGEAGESGSDGEGDANMKEVLEMLRRGEVINVGPQLNPSIAPIVEPAFKSSQTSSSETTRPPSVSTLGSGSTSPQPPRGDPPSGLSQSGSMTFQPKSKVSKFKTSFAASEMPTSHIPSPSDSVPPTPVSNVGRSSPKLSTISDMVIERARTPVVSPSVSRRSEPNASQTLPPTFAATTASPPTPLGSGVVESPTFQKPANSRSFVSQPFILDSPSPSPPDSSRRPQQPPVVMSAQVLERSRLQLAEGSASSEKKVSRFKARRL
ncbi:hypothetical protein JAAARDRAFT_67344 [Jaapia argillacea MUCL 33604]|uniref:DUF3835 domain-containing protein n=1 Tax=Jaapia argillacea MUCL 33604 TaxID=933084 RepID=A0A067Q1T9_9AGAM|nr:hypothetical protein JAAARDRAFT_67344 [Jaapia argillacea MUCL 33604]